MLEEKLIPGDIILMYTDGVFEEFNQELEEWGEERLIEFLINQTREIKNKTADEFLETLLNEIKAFTKNLTFNDDITLIAIRKK